MAFMETKLTKEEPKCFKMTEKEIFKKFGNLHEDELNTKSNKSVYIKNIIMKILLNIVEVKKKRGPRAIEGLEKN